MSADLAFTKEIIEKTAKDLNLPEQTVRYLYKYMLKYLYRQVNNTDCCAFKLPKIGVLYIKSDTIDEILKDRKEQFEQNPDSTPLKKAIWNYTYKRNLVDRFIKFIRRRRAPSYHTLIDSIYKTEINKGKSIEEIQHEQNKIYKQLTLEDY